MGHLIYAHQNEAEFLGELPPATTGRTRCQMARVGAQLLAHPLTGTLAAFTAADGLLVPVAPDASRADGRVDIELLVEAQVPEHTVMVLGCDPALALLGAHLARRYPRLRLVVGAAQ